MLSDSGIATSPDPATKLSRSWVGTRRVTASSTTMTTRTGRWWDRRRPPRTPGGGRPASTTAPSDVAQVRMNSEPTTTRPSRT